MAKSEKLPEWQEHGFTIGSARKWIQHGYQVETANRWRDAGVFSADDANAWEKIGVSPYSVQLMLRAGMTPHDAVLWNELGYSFTEAAERHRAGQRPKPRIWWKDLFGSSSSADYALPEAEAASIRVLVRAGAPQALIFQYLGITPTEAKVLQDKGESALDIISTWWDGGISRTEVADWLGAGFSVAEAKQAQDNGIDANYAAVLRALGGR